MGNTLADLAKMLEEEQTKEIPVDNLTEEEKKLLGVVEGQKTVKVKAVPTKNNKVASNKKTVLPEMEGPTPDKGASEETQELSPSVLESVGNVTVGKNTEAAEAPKVEVTVEEKREYLRCALAMIPFKETFELLDGNVILELRNTNSQEALRLVKLFPFIKNKYGYVNNSITTTIFVNLQFVFYLSSLTVAGKSIKLPEIDYCKSTDQEILEAIEVFNTSMPQLVYKACLNKWLSFSQKVQELERQVIDENF
jgi:predicted transcriptional regulator